MDDLDIARAAALAITHQRMVRWWRLGAARPVSARIIEYVSLDGTWWHRRGAVWDAIPDGPFAAALTVGRSRLGAAVDGDATAGVGRLDPWTANRSRIRSGGPCGRPPVTWPIRAVDLRPRNPVTCRTRSAA